MNMLRATVLSVLIGSSLARSNPKRQVADDEKDSPFVVERANYLGRKISSSIVVGDYLYIDGGEILYKDANDTLHFTDAKSTYSLDVSSSWTNATAVIKQIDKAIGDGRALNFPKLWPSSDNSSFYSYNGDKGWFVSPADPPANKLYKFTSDGSGGGSWSEDNQSYTASSNFTMLARVGGSASACGPDTCYAAGGWRNSRTDNNIENDIPASGIVSYNLTSKQWYNDTLVGSVFLGPWRDGSLFFTEIAGNEGALIAIGGSVSNLAGGNSVPLSLDYVYMYDIANKSWYQQGAEGDVPALPRAEYCTVGIQGDNAVNKTYEIFLYGGFSSDGSSLAYDDVWVLSIPSFQWRQAGHTPVRGRSSHTCSIAGQRQMVVAGGLDPDGPGFSDTVADIWPLGLNVFDLSDMLFKDRYDADASVYTSPEVVKRWYAENGRMANDISDDVKLLFDRSTPTSSTPGSAPTSTHLQPSASSASAHSSVNTGAIAGGVVGGVVALAAVAACVWITLNRRRRQQGRTLNTPRAFESDGRPMFEADSRQTYPEKDADGRQTYEKEALQRHELQ